MIALLLKLDRAGFNPRLTAMFLAFAGIVSFFVVRSLQPADRLTMGLDVIDLKALGDFEFDPFNGTLDGIPADVRNLDRKQISLEGFMLHPLGIGPVTNFDFVYNIYKPHGMPLLVQERVFVTVAPPLKVEMYTEEVKISGTFHVRIERDLSGKVEHVFEMDLAHVEQL